ALLLVPPHILLALRPRLAFGVGRRPVVEESTVHGPRPGPLGRHPVLLPVGCAPRRLVLLLGVATAVDPDAAARRPVGLQRLIAREGLPIAVPAVHLAQDGVGGG